MSLKSMVEDYNKIDLTKIHREGLISQQGAVVFALSWTRRGRPWGDIRVIARSDLLVLIYSVKYDGKQENIEELVHLTWTDCNYGGKRPWMLCPSCRHTEQGRT